MALSAVAAVVEAFQDFGSGLLPEEELRARRRVQLRVPAGTPPVVNLAAARLRGLGATAALWAGEDRQLTQAWAAALHRAGWHGVQYPAAHDPTGRSRSVAVFGPAGGHLPFEDPAWSGGEVSTLHDDEQLRVALRRFGIMVTTSDVQLPMVELGESGLLGAS